MLRLFRHDQILQPPGIAIQPSPIHGLGVFASAAFAAGDVIETAPVILMEQEDKDLLQSTSLFSFYFVVNDAKFPVALGLGYSSLYNHAYSASAVYSISLKNKSITIKACKKISAGDEITLNYNGNADDSTPVYFRSEETPA